MKISELESKVSLTDSSLPYSYLLMNYSASEEDLPSTYKINFSNLSTAIVPIISYDSNTLSQTLNGTTSAIVTAATLKSNMSLNNVENKSSATIRSELTSSNVTTALGFTPADVTATVSTIAYDGTNKKLTKTINGTTSDIVNISTIKTDLALVKDDVGLGNVDNTSDANKPISTATQTALDLKLNTSLKGAVSGLAELDSNGKVPAAQLPSYVDDVIEGYLYENKFYEESAHTTEITGESGKIYIDLTTGARQVYRWGGSAFAAIPIGLALGETSDTAYRGDYGAAAYAHGVTNKGIAAASGLYKITTNSEGHVTAATAVEKADITGLGIPAQDTTYLEASDSVAGLMSASDKAKLDQFGAASTYLTSHQSLSNYATIALVNSLAENFGLTLQLPTSVTWDTTDGLTATVNKFADSTTVVIQKYDGISDWETYDGGERSEGDMFRAYCTRSAFGTTNSGVVGDTYIEPAIE